jgi:hypothetical protein
MEQTGQKQENELNNSILQNCSIVSMFEVKTPKELPTSMNELYNFNKIDYVPQQTSLGKQAKEEIPRMIPGWLCWRKYLCLYFER